ncbi:hypothetical protein VIGAN_02016400, partial [Vigna angularis var. angularis]
LVQTRSKMSQPSQPVSGNSSPVTVTPSPQENETTLSAPPQCSSMTSRSTCRTTTHCSPSATPAPPSRTRRGARRTPRSVAVSRPCRNRQ